MTMQCTAYYIINVLSLQFSKAESFFHLERCRLPSQLFLHLPPIPHVLLLVVDLDSWQVHLSSVTDQLCRPDRAFLSPPGCCLTAI